MKVTALLPDDLVGEVRRLARGENLTESLVTALTEWTALKRIRDLNQKLKMSPLEFKKGFSAAKVRKLNRRDS